MLLPIFMKVVDPLDGFKSLGMIRTIEPPDGIIVLRLLHPLA